MTSDKSLILAINGQDSTKFLQGQLTCDVLSLKPGQSTLGAYCNIKGKVQSLFKLIKTDDGFIMQMHKDLLEPTMKELQKYAIFSKVTLAITESEILNTEPAEEILKKIPALYPETVEVFFPHDINLPALGAVSFTKGCYRGQEIVARMQHRGNLKRSMYIFESTHTAHPGETITAEDGSNAGTVVRSTSANGQTIALAVITDSFSTQPLLLNGNPIQIKS